MQKTKVFWSLVERTKLIEKAIELKQADGDLDGLDLLRQAMTVLPKERRRRIVSASQIPWWSRAIRREMEIRASGEGLAPVVQSLAALSHESLALERCWGRSECTLLRAILAEIRWLRTDLNRR